MFALLLAGGSAYAQEPDKDKPKEEPQKQEESKKGDQSRRRKKNQNKNRRVRRQPSQRTNDRANRSRKSTIAITQRGTAKTAPRNNSAPTDRAALRPRCSRGSTAACRKRSFRASFGREHHFHVQRSDDRRFNYGGYCLHTSSHGPATGTTMTTCTSTTSTANIT